MAALSPASTRQAFDTRRRASAGERIAYVDTIKGLVVAGVIVVHAGMTYGLIGVFAYQEVPTGEIELPVAFVLAAAATLGMGILFLVAGLFTPAAVAHKGGAGFLRGRILRLGLPTLAYLAVVMPALNFAGSWAAGRSPARSLAYALDRLRQGDLGPTWFLLALLLFSAAYAAWTALRLSTPAAEGTGGRLLIAAALLSAAGMFAVRTVQPVTDPAPLNFGVWPQDLAFFAIGARASRSWQRAVPRPAVLQAKLMVLAGVAVLVPLAVRPVNLGDLAGGWHWQAAVLCLGESLATLGFTIWLFRQFQRLGVAPLRRFSRASFPAYLLQSPLTVAFGISMRPLSLPVGVKLPLLAALALVASFGIAAGLSRIGVRRPGRAPSG